MTHVDVINPSHDDDPRDQRGIDHDPDVLIYPPLIPRPTTNVESLQETIASMKSAAGAISDSGQDIKGTWGGLSTHYSAPGSETLFSAMGEVADRGDDVESDIASAASALETFAEAAQTAKERLGSLREEAWDFREEMEAEENWKQNPANTFRNLQIKLAANRNWATYQEAERDCATALSAINGGNRVYTAVGEDPPGFREVAYGIDPKDVPDPNLDLSDLDDWKRINDFTWDHLKNGDKPWPLDWAVDGSMAAWDNFGPGVLWDIGVNGVSATGLWRDGEWAKNNSQRWDNAKAHLKETIQGYGALVGAYGSAGDLRDEDFSKETWGANFVESWKEVAHDLVPWREWEDRPAYTVVTGGGNLVLAVVALPVRVATLGAKIATGSGSSDLDTDGFDVTSHGDPGVAARPGFNLAESIFGTRPGGVGPGGDGLGGIGAGLGDLNRNLLELISRWSIPGGGDSHGGNGTVIADGGPTRPDTTGNTREDRSGSDTGRSTRRDEEFEERSVRELSEEVDRYSRMDATERARLLEESPARVLVGPGGMEIPGTDGLGRGGRNDDSGIRASAEGESGGGRGGTRTQDGQSTGGTALLERDTDGGDGGPSTGDGPAPGGGGGRFDGGGGGGGGDRPGDPSSGADGGGRPPGPKTLAEFERYRWGDKNDPAAQEAFLRDVEYLINNDEDFRKRFYYKNGYRVSETMKIGLEKWQLPKLHKEEGTGWFTPLKEPESPNFFGDKTRVRFNKADFLKDSSGNPLVGEALERRQKLREEFKGLDDLAVDRREKIDEADRLNDIFKEEEKKHGKYKDNGENHPELEEAHRKKAEAYHQSTKASERFGERSADIAARYEFDGSPLLDKKGNPVMRDVLDDEGNKVGEEPVVKPNLEGAKLLGEASGAPKNGNSQFDLIYETSDGEIVIIEAKSSTDTSLGSRVHKPVGGKAVDTMQGTEAYLDSILQAMESRGNKSTISIDGDSRIGGVRESEDGEGFSVGEARLVEYIRQKKRQGKISYALFKGDPKEVGGVEVANGYDYQIFYIG